MRFSDTDDPTFINKYLRVYPPQMYTYGLQI